MTLNKINLLFKKKNHYFIVGPVIPHSSQDRMSCRFKFLISLTVKVVLFNQMLYLFLLDWDHNDLYLHDMSLSALFIVWQFRLVTSQLVPIQTKLNNN